MSQVLYRKYRPTKLADVVGQEHVTKVLASAIQQGKIGHAYLFIGPRGTGKTSVARIFAHAVNGFDYQVEDSYLDIIEIDAASNTGVDNIRELREKAIIAPTRGKYKVYIIDEVHMLTKSASNALLKTLEEPPAHVIFIMATTDAHKVPITISSRTQVHTFRLAEPAIMQAHLRKIADLEKIPITDEALEVVVRRGGGSFRDSLSLLDQITTLSDGEITADLLNQALGLPDQQNITELLQAFTAGDFSQIHQILKDLLNTGLKPEILAGEILQHIIDHPSPELLPLLTSLPSVEGAFPEAKLLLALLGPLQAGAKSTKIVESASVATTMRSTQPKRSVASEKTTGAEKLKSTANEVGKVAATRKKPAQKEKLAQSSPESAQAEEPSAEPEKPIAATSPVKSVQIDSQPFAWEDFTEAIKAESGALYNQLLKVSHDFDGQILHLFPSQKFTKSILEKPANSQILSKHLSGVALVVHNVGEQLAPEDDTISQISAIMGGVQEIKGEMPF